MCIDMRMRFSMNFGHKQNLLLNFLEFIGRVVVMPMKPGNNFFENSGHLKFSHTENSWELLDQYYRNNCGQ